MKYIIPIFAISMLLLSPLVLAGSASYTQKGSVIHVDVQRESPFLIKTITPNTGTNIALGSVARFTVSQVIKYNCPIAKWDFINVAVYIFKETDLNTYADNAFLQIQGDNLELACDTSLSSTFWYGTNLLPAGDYRLYVNFVKDGKTLSDPEFIKFSLYKTIEAPVATPTPLTPGNPNYTPPSTYTPPPIFTPTPSGTPQIIIINQTSPATPAPSNSLTLQALLPFLLIGLGVFAYMRKR